MKIIPFKLKKEYIEDSRVLSIAQQLLGNPSEINYEGKISLMTHRLSWRFWGNESVCNLTISYKINDEFIGIEFLEDYFSSDNTISIGINDFKPDWKSKLQELIATIKKPWSDWTDQEIISDPKWIYFYWKENREILERHHNAMVMFSYENPNSLWVKRYFNEQDQNKES